MAARNMREANEEKQSKEERIQALEEQVADLEVTNDALSNEVQMLLGQIELYLARYGALQK